MFYIKSYGCLVSRYVLIYASRSEHYHMTTNVPIHANWLFYHPIKFKLEYIMWSNPLKGGGALSYKREYGWYDRMSIFWGKYWFFTWYLSVVPEMIRFIKNDLTYDTICLDDLIENIKLFHRKICPIKREVLWFPSYHLYPFLYGSNPSTSYSRSSPSFVRAYTVWKQAWTK